MKSIFILNIILLLATTSLAGTGSQAESTNSSSQLNNIQNAIKQNNVKWIASENSISRLTLDDQKLLFGIDMESIKLDDHKKMDIPAIQDLPAIFSWRDNDGDWLTPVKNQHVQQCGSCWAFAAVAQVESWWKIKNEQPDSMIDLSEQFLISCSPAGDCTSGWTPFVLEYISQVGIPTETCMPYLVSDTVDCESCCEDWKEEAVKIPGWGWVTTDEDNIINIKNAVYRQPVTSHMDVYLDFTTYEGGVYEHVTGPLISGHAVVIYGWDDTEQSWLCKNSTGQDWGEEGHFRIKWGDSRIGHMTLVIWDEMTQDYPFMTTPEKIEADLGQGSSYETNIKIKNNKSDQLEFSSFVYGTESTFHPSDYNSYDGSSIWCGDEKLKGYGNWWIKYLDTPVLNLTTTYEPELSCLMKWSTDGGPIREFDGRDGGNIMISDDGGANFELLVPETPLYNCDSLLSFWMYGLPFGTGGWSGKSDWQQVQADLSSYKSEQVIIRFTFATTDYNCTEDNSTWKGLFIDSLQVKDNATIIYENQGDNIDDMRRCGLGGTSCDWIEISENPGLVAPGDSIQLNININTTELDAGTYKGSIILATNDKYYEYYEIPIQLDLSTAIQSSTNMVPQEFILNQNYPNPFNPKTVIHYTVGAQNLVPLQHIDLSIYNILGQKVATLVNKKQQPRTYSVEWDASGFASGVYLYRLQAGTHVETKKMILIK